MEYTAVLLLESAYMVAFLLVTSAGLAVIFGMMRVINLAHGEFVMIGGYTTIMSAKAGVNIFVSMLLLAPLVVGLLGWLVERLLVRRLYGRMIDTMLATWGLSLLLIGLITLIFGNTPVSVPAPIGGYSVAGYQVSGYNLFIIAVAAVVMAGLWTVLRFTRAGLVARGAIQAPEVVATLGHDTRAIYLRTFVAGAALAGLAGGVLAPLTGLLPTSGTTYVAKAFITVIVGGPSIVAGVLSSAAGFGTVTQLVFFNSTPVLGEMAMLLLAIVLLRLMPRGISGRFFQNSP